MQSKLQALTAERDELVRSLDTHQTDTDKEQSRLKAKTADLERQLGQVTYLKEELEGSLTEERRLHAACADKLNRLQLRSNELYAENARIEAKLEEVTISEQELAWQKEALTTQLKDNSHLETIRQLEVERQDLRGTVDKLSVKLYKVVGFLDEMVQEQEDIIKGSMSQCSSSQDTTGSQMLLLEEGGPLCAAAVKAAGSMASDLSERPNQSSLHRISNASGMKEQISAVIDSVVEDMPKPPPKALASSLGLDKEEDRDVDEEVVTADESMVVLGTAAISELDDVVEVAEEQQGEEETEQDDAVVLP